MLIDTHTHMYSEQFDADRTEMIQRAIRNGVNHLTAYAIHINRDSRARGKR